MRIYLFRFSTAFWGAALSILSANREYKRKNILQFPDFDFIACRLFHLEYYQFSESDTFICTFKTETYFPKPFLKWNILEHSHQDTSPLPLMVKSWPLPPDVKEKGKNAGGTVWTEYTE